MESSLQEEIDVTEVFLERARSDVLAFTLATKEDYAINWHHRNLANKLNAFARGDIRFLMVFMPPRHGKSELVSRRFPAFLHGLYPDAEIMAASYLDSLAGDMCIDVQNIIDSPMYRRIFPETKIWPTGTSYTKGTRNSSEHHIVGKKGKYRGQGVGGSFTGKGANFIIIDDPIKGREIADSVAFRERLWNFYNNDLFSRLETNLETGRLGQVLITQCMTGDTLVLMSNNTQKPLQDIKVGDSIVTYDNGKITTSTIKNWKCCGPDLVYAIRTSSGITVKANERHPFLISRNGILEWVRLKDLKLNDKMIRAGEIGLENSAQLMDANNLQSAKDIAPLTTIKPDGHQVTDHPQLIQNQEEKRTFDKDTESAKKNTTQNSQNKMEIVQFVKLQEPVLTTGNKGSALTTVTTLEKSEGCCAMSATKQLDTEILSKFFSTLSITCDHIVEIKEIGIQDVFDIEVDRTENFIANGLVSHNTRWHEDDLSGRLIDLMNKDQNAVQWEILNYPAIRVDLDDPTDIREIGEPLWPAKYNIPQLEQIKASAGPRAWGSLYQQSPTPDGGTIFNESMFAFQEMPSLFDWSFVIGDTSYKEKQENDFTVFTAFGVIDDTLYVRDVWMKQIKAVDVEKPVEAFIRPFCRQYGFRGTYIEPKGHGIYLCQKFAERNLVIPSDSDLAEFFKDRRFDKSERANNVVPHLGNRKVIINRNIGNKEELVNQCLGFPKVKHDDFVDTLIDGLKMVYARDIGILDVL